MEELSKLRDELYEALPTGKIDAFELIQVIKNHISKLDELIELKKLRVGDVIKNEVAVCKHDTVLVYDEFNSHYCKKCREWNYPLQTVL